MTAKKREQMYDLCSVPSRYIDIMGAPISILAEITFTIFVMIILAFSFIGSVPPIISLFLWKTERIESKMVCVFKDVFVM